MGTLRRGPSQHTSVHMSAILVQSTHTHTRHNMLCVPHAQAYGVRCCQERRMRKRLTLGQTYMSTYAIHSVAGFSCTYCLTAEFSVNNRTPPNITSSCVVKIPYTWPHVAHEQAVQLRKIPHLPPSSNCKPAPPCE